MADQPLLVPPAVTVLVNDEKKPVLYDAKGYPLLRATGFQCR